MTTSLRNQALTIRTLPGKVMLSALVLLTTLTLAIEPGKEVDAPPQSGDAVGHPSFMSPHSSPIALVEERVFAVNTPADTVDVLDAETRKVTARVPVGIDPVSIAVRPDGKEVWVSNHISDSVSVIDSDRASPSYLQIVATIQEFDEETRATQFDEPVGIAFAGNSKAYVALSSENEIAVVDVRTRSVTRRLRIPAQDPRAIRVVGDRLYVLPFESNNKTQLSGGTGKIDGDLVTFNAHTHAIANNNVLSIGAVQDIIKNPRVPDRDLFVFDTKTDELLETVDTLGTLLYGMAVDSKGRVFVAQTDARNDANGRAGTESHGLAELDNRAFLNRITSVSFQADSAETPQFFDLEPLPPKQPKFDEALATPFAIEVSRDDSTLVVSAAGSDKLFTLSASEGKVLGSVAVDAVPRGIALEHSTSGKATRAWVLNAVANSISLVDLSDVANPELIESVALEDPTHPVVKRGRIAFNTAAASTTGTFSCASCHPDGHTDQLLWVLKTPIVTGGKQIMPRSTMPIRGLRDTAPYHWDGIPGDPYGGNNSANVHGNDPPNSDKDDATSTTRHLIDGGLAATMSRVGDKSVNDEGKSGALSRKERDDMATFLLSVPYPPAQKRSYTNEVSKRARDGFKLFHIDGDHDGKPAPNVCGNCHRMPFWVSTNTPGTGMDAPTWRGAYDRFLILPQGRLNIIDFDFYRRIAEKGIPERNMWQFSWGGRRRFDPVWDMVLEGSTGVSGSFGRQVTLNETTAEAASTSDLLAALEVSAAEGGVVLEAEGIRFEESSTKSIALRFDAKHDKGSYVDRAGKRDAISRAKLISMAAKGELIVTLTARHGDKANVDHPQPGLWTEGPIERQRGRQDFPILFEGEQKMTLSARHVEKGAVVIVDGRRTQDQARLRDDERLEIEVEKLPAPGMHLLQVQNPGGLFSNDFIFHVVKDKEGAAELRRRAKDAHTDRRVALANAIRAGDLAEVRRLFRLGASRHSRHPRSGATPISDAALHGHIDIVRYLLRRGTRIGVTNRDGNTALHVAAFLCRTEIVELLLDAGASPVKKNDRGDTALSSATSPWTKELAGFYSGLNRSLKLDLDLKAVEKKRPEIAKLLEEHVEDKP